MTNNHIETQDITSCFKVWCVRVKAFPTNIWLIQAFKGFYLCINNLLVISKEQLKHGLPMFYTFSVPADKDFIQKCSV